ncbi:MAG: type I polyketide synthase [Cyanobacteria bacterium P01_A01_bin.83]
MEPIAVIGIGCRFPQAPNPAAFWQLLRNGKEAIAPIPQDRWHAATFYDPDPDTPGKMNVGRGGFLEQVDKFDADFFGMTAEEVEHTDPQQRLFLEVAWEALENAGIAPASLAKSQTGVFTGLCTIDYHRLLYKNYNRLGSYSGTGTTMSITANRLSYLLNLQGPSMAIDAACSSSLVTVHLACQSLRSGESELCLAGGVNLILSPDSTISSAKTRLLSAQGRCKSFDAEADGYARGEGCGMVVLKRLSDAVAHNDNILALIRGSAVNHNGLSNSLSAPNGLAQQAVIRQALKNAVVEPAEVSYIDAHAVGTGIGDAIEFKALQAVYSTNRSQPCGVGSVKTNIGHLEAAAGISALIKVILALKHQEIPPHLHLKQLNPYISLKNAFYIPTQLQSWSRGENRRLAGVSAFGFGGTNAHVILEEAPQQQRKLTTAAAAPALVTLSASCEPALQQLAQKYRDFLEAQPQVDLGDLAFTTNIGRNHFKYRLCLVAQSLTQLQEQLRAFISDRPGDNLLTGEIKGRKRPKIAWFFPGNTIDSPTVAWLRHAQPAFRRAIERCEKILQLYLSQPMFTAAPVTELGRDRCCAFAIEYALAQLWLAWGIKPQAVMGRGVGQLVAAAIAGVMELEVALRLVANRPLQTAEAACSCLSEAKIEQYPACEGRGLRSLRQIRPPILLLSPGRNLAKSKTVTPESGLDHWHQTEIDDSPLAALSDYPLVLVLGARTTFPTNNTQYLFSYGADPETCWQEMMQSLGMFYVRGMEIDWRSFTGDRRPISLPTYPFQRQRYWFASAEEVDHKQIPQLL